LAIVPVYTITLPSARSLQSAITQSSCCVNFSFSSHQPANLCTLQVGWHAGIHIAVDVNSQLCEHAQVAVVAYHTIGSLQLQLGTANQPVDLCQSTCKDRIFATGIPQVLITALYVVHAGLLFYFQIRNGPPWLFLFAIIMYTFSYILLYATCCETLACNGD
jgi:hypothetical protein